MRKVLTDIWTLEKKHTAPSYWYWLLVFLSLIFAAAQLGLRDEIKPFVVMMMLTGGYVLLKYHPELRQSPWLYFILAAAAIPLVSWALVSIQEPEMASSSPRSEELLDKFLFIIPALILAGNCRNTLLFWGVGLIGVLTLPWVSGSGYAELQAALDGARSGFGRHIISMGMVHGAILIGLLVFFSRMVLNPRFSLVRFIIWFLLVAYMFFAILASQTRAVYLGAFVVFLIGLVWLSFYYRSNPRAWRESWKIYCLIFILVAVFFKVFQGTELFEATWQRTLNEFQVYQLVLSGEWDKIPRNSAGLRIHFWADVLKWSSERPLFGWGYGAGQLMHENAGNWFGDRYFITVHNDFLEILITYGLAGLFFLVFFFFWVGRQMLFAWRSGVMPNDFLAFFVLFFVFYFLNGVFISSFFFRDTVYLFNMVLAGLSGFIIKNNWVENGR